VLIAKHKPLEYPGDYHLEGADLSEASLENALSLIDTDLRGVKELAKERLETYKAKGDIVDEVPPTSASSQPSHLSRHRKATTLQHNPSRIVQRTEHGDNIQNVD